MNNDLPGNLEWETLFKAIPDAKVILTVRDNEDSWYRSWVKYALSQVNKNGWMTRRLTPLMIRSGALGSMQYKVQSLIAIFLHRLLGTPFSTFSEYPPMCQPLEIGANMPEHLIRKAYRDHNQEVIDKVPKDQLLIWDLKDGWEPICEFLNCPIPSEPIPRCNVAGDTQYFAKLFAKKLGTKKMLIASAVPIFWFCVMPTVTIGLGVYFALQ